tara:strand:- start:63 stop:914 length:852 start_codon:yes stop_codon:yes gene_type:complete
MPDGQNVNAAVGTFTGAFTSLGIDDNADATALTIDSGENVAIGVTSKNSSNNGSLTIGHTGMTKVTASANGNADELVLIGANASANVGMSMIGNNANQNIIYFGDEDDADIGGIIYDHNGDYMAFQTNTAEAMRISSIGAVTKPLQPAFLVQPSSTQSNISLSAYTTVSFDTEIFDNNADFASHTFTAPVTGKYQFNCSLYFTGIDTDTNFYQLYITTSNRSHLSIVSGDGFNADPSYHTINHSVLTDMDANDTCYIRLQISGGGAATADLTTQTRFSGYLVA